MAREMLFKAKRTDNGEWSEGALFDGIKYCVIGQTIKFSPYIENECKIVGFKVDRDTLCQYTGLTDKNGNKIWENDVVRYTDELVGMVKQDLIVWSGDCCSFARKHKSKYAAGFQYLWINERTSKELEVIGNIFDNPELLGGGE